MVLYDGLINQIEDLLKTDIKQLPASALKLQDGDKNDILFAKDTAFELGGSQLPCVSTLAVSSSIEFSNEVYLVGKDLMDIKKDSPFGKVVLLQVDDFENDDDAFNKIKELEQLRYKFCVKDFMTRASAFSLREQIRVGKKAIKNGVSFADYGNKLIEKYLENPVVKSAKVIFITDFNDFQKLNILAEKVKDVTSALNHILDNINFDCASCNLKPICDEVEGMKELHKKKIK